MLNMVSTPDVHKKQSIQTNGGHVGDGRSVMKSTETPRESLANTSGQRPGMLGREMFQAVKDLFVIFHIIGTTLHPPATITHLVIYVKHRHANPVIPSSLSACRRGSSHLKDPAAVDWEEILNNICV